MFEAKAPSVEQEKLFVFDVRSLWIDLHKDGKKKLGFHI